MSLLSVTTCNTSNTCDSTATWCETPLWLYPLPTPAVVLPLSCCCRCRPLLILLLSSSCRPRPVVVVPSSSCRRRAVLVLSSLCRPHPVIVVLSSSCRRCAILVLSSLCHPRRCPSHPIVVPSFPLPHRLVLVLFVVTCSTHDPSCKQWLAAMGVGAGSFRRCHRPPLPGFLVLIPLSCSSSLSCRGRPPPLVSSSSSSSSWLLAPLVRPRTPTVHPARSGGVGAGWPSSSCGRRRQ